MIYIGLSILASVGLFVIFRLFATYGIHTRQAIMVNYFIATLFGFLLYPPSTSMVLSIWFGPALLLGVLFYLIFQVMARVTQENGMSISSIATKMSVIMPVAAGILLIGETTSWTKFTAIGVGLLAIALSAGGSIKGTGFKWPLVLFFGSGAIDTALKLFQHYWVEANLFPQFCATIFLGAFATSFFHHVVTNSDAMGKRTLVGGVVLGLVNFLALYAILLALGLPGWESSVVFPLNNVGIIAGSTLLAVFGLKEKLTLRGWIGFVMATLSIGMLYFAS